MRTRHILQVLGIAALGLACTVPAIAQLRLDGPADDSTVMHIGEIEVHGQQEITRTLQAIKVALTRPYSNDPKLANVMVCRLEDAPGSHVQQQLVCGTNRILSLRRSSLQSNYTAATAQNTVNGPKGTGCYNDSCYTAVFEQLNETIATLPGHYLDQTVNGPALRKALKDTPMPAADAPTATPNAAPAAASSPHTI